MHVKTVSSTQEWEKFIQTQEFSPFVQSSRYIEFYKALKEDGFILGIYEENELVGGALVVTTHAKRGNFLYVPYGPFLPKHKTKESLEHLIHSLTEYARNHDFIFIRVSPFLEDNEENRKLFQSTGFRNAPMHVLAENTWILNIQKNEETLLREMNKNHRNLIRRCEREGVKIVKTHNSSSLEGLHSLLDITAKRHGFRRFSREYILQEFESFRPDNVLLFEAYLADGTLDSAAIIMFFGNMVAYRHSASLNVNSKIPSSYLLQWEVIKEAQKRGMTWYNFWGIAPENATKDHPFYGITHFKKGFGGFKKDLLHCQDLPVSKKYWINWIIESFRRIHRGF